MSDRKTTKKKRRSKPLSGPPPRICPRCGAETDEQLLLGRQRVCGECLDDALHPLESTELRFGPMFRATVDMVRLLGVRAVFLAWIMNAPIALILLRSLESPADPSASVASQPMILVSLYAMFAGPLYYGALTELGLQRLDHAAPSLSVAFGRAARRYLGMFLATFLKQLVVGVLCLTVVLLPLGIMRWLSYLLVEPMVITGEANGADGLHRSGQRMKKHRWLAFQLSLVFALLPWVLSFLQGFEVLPALAAEANLSEVHAVASWLVFPLFVDLAPAAMALAFHARLRRAVSVPP